MLLRGTGYIVIVRVVAFHFRISPLYFATSEDLLNQYLTEDPNRLPQIRNMKARVLKVDKIQALDITSVFSVLLAGKFNQGLRARGFASQIGSVAILILKYWSLTFSFAAGSANPGRATRRECRLDTDGVRLRVKRNKT